MNVLDIDIDIFLDHLPTPSTLGGRLESSEYHAWTPKQVEKYLTQRCKLRKNHPLPGKVVRHHHELFDVWDSMITDGRLEMPFRLTHIDSHADMGMGDGSCCYIFAELLKYDLSARRDPPRNGIEGLDEGNYLAYAVACRWIKEVTYVHHPELYSRCLKLPDIPNGLFRDNDPECGIIQFKLLPAKFRNGLHKPCEFDPLALEPEVPITFIDRDEFSTTDSFSFIFATQSPEYTPATSDPILDTIDRFIQPI